MGSQSTGNATVRSLLNGIGITVLFLLLGVVLDYILTQVLSQFILADCSENCYFRYFNSFFAIVAFVSVAAGLRSGFHTYRRLTG